MPIRAPQIPSYCHHKAKSLAYMRPGTEFVYLGAYDSPESKLKYDRVVTEWLARGRTPAPAKDAADGLSINELLLAYVRFAQDFYRDTDGAQTLEVEKIAQSIVPLKEM
jgi:hypothetical protein